MASGAPCILIHNVSPPGTLFAPPDWRTGGSTPAEQVSILKFDAATIWYMDYYCQLVNYTGGGLTFSLPWSAASATTGVTRWGIAIRRVADDAEDVDASHTYDYNEVDDTAASASGEISVASITFTSGADMDSWANGEFAVVRVQRNAAHGNDTMAGNAELWALYCAET